MKSLFLFFALALTPLTFSQIDITKDLATGKLGTGDWRIIEHTKGDNVRVYFYLGFQNSEYKLITDIGSIMFVDSTSLSSFVDLLVQMSELPPKTNASAEFKTAIGGKSRLYLYDFSTAIYLADEEGKNYSFSKKHAQKFIEQIKPHISLLSE